MFVKYFSVSIWRWIIMCVCFFLGRFDRICHTFGIVARRLWTRFGLCSIKSCEYIFANVFACLSRIVRLVRYWFLLLYCSLIVEVESTRKFIAYPPNVNTNMLYMGIYMAAFSLSHQHLTESIISYFRWMNGIIINEKSLNFLIT